MRHLNTSEMRGRKFKSTTIEKDNAKRRTPNAKRRTDPYTKVYWIVGPVVVIFRKCRTPK
jgi:hypothetical protein